MVFAVRAGEINTDPVPTRLVKPASSNQLIVPLPVAVKDALPPEHTVVPERIGAIGSGLTVTPTATLEDEQVPLFSST